MKKRLDVWVKISRCFLNVSSTFANSWRSIWACLSDTRSMLIETRCENSCHSLHGCCNWLSINAPKWHLLVFLMSLMSLYLFEWHQWHWILLVIARGCIDNQWVVCIVQWVQWVLNLEKMENFLADIKKGCRDKLCILGSPEGNRTPI